MADFSGLSLTGGAYNPNVAFGGASATGTNLLSGSTGVNSFSPTASNYYSAPNPAFSGTALTLPNLKTAAPTSPLTNQAVPSFGSATHVATTPTPTTLPSGAVGTTYGNTVTSPTTFGINTSGPIGSNALNSGLSSGDVANARSQYAQYVQGLSQAQQYSPAYLAALNAVNQNKAQGAALTSNFYTGNNEPGDTTQYAQGFTTREQALNDIQGLAANQALQVQELQRQGNIAGANALVQAAQPTSVAPGSSLVDPLTGQESYSGLGGYTGVQAVQTYNNLQQNFPDANIPAYNAAMSPEQNLQIAQQAATQSPSFQSRNLAIVTDSAGGIHLLNKNDVQGLTQTGDGTYTFLTPQQAAQQSADKSSLNQQQSYADTITRSLSTADQSFQQITALMQKAGINNSSSPIINQLNNKLQSGVIGNGDVVAFQSAISDLRSEYSQVLAKGGVRSVETDNAAAGLIPDTLSLSALQKVQKQIATQGAIAVKSANSQVAAINQRLSAPASSGSGVYNF